MQELAFDESAMRHIPKSDVMEAGLPCSGASVAGRAKRGTPKPEDHPEVGHLVVAALVIIAKANPAVLLLENVVPYASSASASILRNQLRDMGYITHETVLRGEDFNALEHRDRWCMVAVTEGMHFDWDMLQLPVKKDLVVSDILDDIAEDDPMWSEMTGLKAKQERDIEAGKGFLMQIVKGDESKIPTLTKGLAKNRSTDPKIQHPSNPALLRMPTPAEHARAKQYPPSIVAGLSKTIAHEMLGQGVLRDPFVAASKLLGDSIKDFVFEHNVTDKASLIKAIETEISDTSSLVVSEIRSPMSGVAYEGPVSINDLGMVVQDIGNGVGILHKHSALQGCQLGEMIKVKYPSAKAQPDVQRMSTPAPHQTETVSQLVAANQASRPAFVSEDVQRGLFEPDTHTTRSTAPRMG
jgi:DNA (cytosine-5)-methyltransferase 1